jgi:hypothetical protein
MWLRQTIISGRGVCILENTPWGAYSNQGHLQKNTKGEVGENFLEKEGTGKYPSN